MAVYREANEDTLLTCPFNPYHRVAKRRLQIHIASCGKSAGPGWAICPFNQSHRHPVPDMKAHVLTCPDNRQALREATERFAIRQRESEGRVSSAFKPPPVIGLSDPDNARDPWAEEGAAAGQQNFLIRGLGENFDAEDFINNVDPDVAIDPICLQRLSASQRTAYYRNRNRAFEVKRKRIAQEKAEKERLASVSSSGNGRGNNENVSNVIVGAANTQEPTETDAWSTTAVPAFKIQKQTVVPVTTSSSLSTTTIASVRPNQQQQRPPAPTSATTGQTLNPMILNLPYARPPVPSAGQAVAPVLSPTMAQIYGSASSDASPGHEKRLPAPSAVSIGRGRMWANITSGGGRGRGFRKNTGTGRFGVDVDSGDMTGIGPPGKGKRPHDRISAPNDD